MKKISRRSFLAAAAVSAAALALTACGGSASTASSAAASSVAASSEAASTSAAAAELTTVEAGKLTMATNATFPPYEMTTDAGTIEGIDVDTAQAIARSWAWSCRSTTWILTPLCSACSRARPTSPWQASLSPTSGWL